MMQSIPASAPMLDRPGDGSSTGGAAGGASAADDCASGAGAGTSGRQAGRLLAKLRSNKPAGVSGGADEMLPGTQSPEVSNDASFKFRLPGSQICQQLFIRVVNLSLRRELPRTEVCQ